MKITARVHIDKETVIAVLALVGIVFYVLVRFIFRWPIPLAGIPLYVVLAAGLPLISDLLLRLFKAQFGSDLLAGISIVTAVILHEYLAGALVVLMLSGGGALERFSLRRASSVLEALSKRMPNRAHRRQNGQLVDIAADAIHINDECVVFPHEICPVDGIVIEGHGSMDESYLTGEPFVIPKTIGTQVMSGAINAGESLIIRALRPASDSRYSKIMQVMRESQQSRPRLRRLGDYLGAWYTPLAMLTALGAGVIGADSHRFLAVLVIATPCPLLIGIPVAIIGAISLSARRGIIIKDPAILEQLDECRTIIFDKTGTLTYGQPHLTKIICFNNYLHDKILQYAASLERYSKHPLASAVVEAAQKIGLDLLEAVGISEKPGEGLKGMIDEQKVYITGRKTWIREHPDDTVLLPSYPTGLECVVVMDGIIAALFRFNDKPRVEGRSFVDHLGPQHQFSQMMIVSGDREEEVKFMADQMGIKEIYAGQSPESKVTIVRDKTKKAKTIYIGDGINDAPALLTATVGIAFGKNSDITSEAAGAVIMESSLRKIDELFHIARHMRRIALQSAIGGMALSLAGMVAAALGYLPPVAGAISQEIIDLIAIINALRVSFMGRTLSDF